MKLWKIPVSNELIATMIRGELYCGRPYWCIENKLPDDAVLVSVDRYSDTSVAFIFTSESFDEVPDGEEPPIKTPVFQTGDPTIVTP